MKFLKYIATLLAFASSAVAANFAMSENIPIVAPLFVNSTIASPIVPFNRIIQVDTDCSVLFVNFSIPAYGHSSPGTRSRIWLEIDGVAMADGSKYSTNTIEAKPITLSAILTNVPANTNLNVRIIVQVERGQSGIYQNSNPSFPMFASISAFGLA